MIDTEPDVRDTYINLRVNADRLTLPDGTARSINGVVLVRPSRPAEFKYGDRIRVTGDRISPPEFATFSHKDFLARQNIFPIIDRPRVSLAAHDQASPLLATIFAFKGSGSIATQCVPAFNPVKAYDRSVVIVVVSVKPAEGHAPAPSATCTPRSNYPASRNVALTDAAI